MEARLANGYLQAYRLDHCIQKHLLTDGLERSVLGCLRRRERCTDRTIFDRSGRMAARQRRAGRSAVLAAVRPTNRTGCHRGCTGEDAGDTMPSASLCSSAAPSRAGHSCQFNAIRRQFVGSNSRPMQPASRSFAIQRRPRGSCYFSAQLGEFPSLLSLCFGALAHLGFQVTPGTFSIEVIPDPCPEFFQEPIRCRDYRERQVPDFSHAVSLVVRQSAASEARCGPPQPCVDGPCIARVVLFSRLGIGAVMCPACSRGMTAAGPDEVRWLQSPIKQTLMGEHGCGRGVWIQVSTHSVFIN